MPINKLPTLALESNAITADLIASGAITAADISDGEITAAKLHTTLDFSTKIFTMAAGAVTAHQAALSITESQISDLQSYLTAETNDLTSAVTWANVPDANITQTSVTQHQAALSITESQISDLQSYVLPNDSPTFTNTILTGYLAGPATFTIDPAAVGDNTGTVVIAGNLQVDGTTTTINSTTVEVDDLNITLASGAADATAANGAGITVDGASANITYNGTTDEWEFNKRLQLDNDEGIHWGTGNGRPYIKGDQSAGTLQLSDGGTPSMTVKTDNIGIGDSNPLSKLVVSDGVQTSTGISGGGTFIEVARTSGGDAGLVIQKNTANWVMGVDNSDGNAAPLRFEYSPYGAQPLGLGAGTLGLALAYNGGVGIGTTSIGSRLTVDGIDEIAKFQNTSANTNVRMVSSDTGTNYITFQDTTASSGGIRYYHGNNSMTFKANDSDMVVLNSDGDWLPQTTTQDLGSTSNPWQNIYTQDMHLSNESRETGNEIDGTKGNWTIQEGAEDLYIINNKTGKRFRFKLEEIE